jgi:hypothetical protein
MQLHRWAIFLPLRLGSAKALHTPLKMVLSLALLVLSV